MVSEDGSAHVGSILIQDSIFTNVDTAILTQPVDSSLKNGTIGITLDNIALNSVNTTIADKNGNVILGAEQTNIGMYIPFPLRTV